MVFVDEPTTGVDVGTRRFIWDRMREAARERCVVLTMHYIDANPKPKPNPNPKHKPNPNPSPDQVRRAHHAPHGR